MVRTSSGFECNPNQKLGNDWRCVDDLAECESDVPFKRVLAIRTLLNLVLTEKEKMALYKHVEEEDGTVPTDRIMKEIKEIFNGIGDQAKNQ